MMQGTVAMQPYTIMHVQFRINHIIHVSYAQHFYMCDACTFQALTIGVRWYLVCENQWYAIVSTPPLSQTAANSTIPMGGTQPTQRVQDGGQLTKRPTRRVHRDIPTSYWRSTSSGRVWGYGYASKSTDPQTSACTANEHNRTGRRRTTSGTQACPHYRVAHVPSPTLPTIMWAGINARAPTHLHTNITSDSQTHTTAHTSIACGSTKKTRSEGVGVWAGKATSPCCRRVWKAAHSCRTPGSRLPLPSAK